ncbi:Fe-S cluster assembly protein SufD [Actinomycetaceae bacterium WB03_NA08]|uniref:Fe-S cluster assembly protein SufD n=1 Tax=Scrofimicrobium canadense TaxID=2652290 RepID=A0A6N7W3G1_9ACTO|nr:Fe-S cluster assembly protein SufD [Scrofimicrobium canadense]MSS83951.1 Fe-S cluster assembly protein SufD [Scrofimicrobium canadense]
MADIVTKTHASRADRPTSFNVDDIPVPMGREEDWRFTPLRRIEKLFDPQGYTQRAKLEAKQSPQEVFIEKVGRDDPRVGTVLAPGDRTAVVAWEAFDQATVITIPRGVELENPVIVDVRATEELSTDHIVIRAEPLSKGTVLLRHEGPAALNQTVEVRAEDGAQLSVIAVHEWDRDAVHASNHRVSVGRDASLDHLVVTLGGDLVRVCVDTEYTAPGGTLRLNGIYFVDAGQHLEHRVFVDHSEPNCYSRVVYKGALQGQDARSVWIGDCLIGENADATDTYELNRNLILSEGAKADSVPNLEIENGEIEGAGHASATGRFDDEQLFYLMSRGISAVDARRLVVRGFFAELINKIEIEEVRDHLLDAIEDRLQGAH